MVANIYDTSAAALNTAGSTLTNTVAPGALSQSMNSFLSPYLSTVLNDSVSRLRDRKNVDMNSIGAQAQQSGAYGGSRHGVVEAQTLDNYGREEDELVARMLQQGFDTSAGLATTELGLQQAGASGLMNLGQTGFGIGQATQQGQMQSGTMQQQMLQAILGGASQDYGTYSNYPTQQLSTLLSALSGNPLSGNVSQSQSYSPGLFDYMSMGMGSYNAGK